jgi:glycosyltransferase involved in cell wall biosynthesis
MKYSVVIPTYNHCEKYLKPCIDSIIKYSNMNDIELIISANGCKDNTQDYLTYLYSAIPHLVLVWDKEPLGFAKATNAGIKAASCDKIILLNNDTVLLEQEKNQWLNLLAKPFEKPNCGITGVLKQHSPATQRDFLIFFCVMIDKKVFDSIGFLNEEYGVGGCEDIEFCMEAERAGFEIHEVCEKKMGEGQWVSYYPIYHKAEGTMHDPSLVKDWNNIFYRNTLKLNKKYNPEHYKFLLSNNYERAVFFKNNRVFPRERQRYEWAAKNIYGKYILEIGCSTGYGSQFFPSSVEYLGFDYDPIIVDVAKEQEWGCNTHFEYADVNDYAFGHYDTIVAFEVVEHLDNGLEIVEKLKQHCDRLLITVPWNEPKGFWGEHHKLHGLNESHFKGFEFEYINQHGHISSSPQPINENNICNLMILKWTKYSAL